MRKRWVMLTFVLLLRSTGGSGAAPLDSPDTVYIDGMPCNRLCQSYMAWSRQSSSMPAPRPPKAAARRVTGMGGNRSKLATPAGNTTGQSYTARAGVADAYATGGAVANSNARTIREPGAVAAAVAEYGTPPMASPPEAKGTGGSGPFKGPPRGDAEKTAPAAPNEADHLVALLMARPEIKSVSDLTGKNIAIDYEQSASTGNVQRAIAAAGATEVQLSTDQTTALNRLISGEVPAAVVTLAYPESAEWSPAIAGFKVFRIPLSRPNPADNAAAGSNTRTLMQIAAATALAEKVTGVAAIPAPNPALPNKVVAVLMARPEIKSVSDLTGKTIAIDDGQSASKENMRTALVAAGAIETQLSEGQTKAVDRLISREASAAVLTLVSPEAAEWFPDVAGFKIFRIPLSPASLKERPEPADNAAAGSNTRTLMQIAAATALAEKVTGVAAIAASNPPSPNKAVAVLMARQEIKSVSDLTGKTIAIDDGQSASTDNVRTALAALGAAEAQLSEGQAKAVDRLISGEVPAAVLTLVSSEAAEWFPDVAGFKIFRIPLSPPSLKALP
jgi:TRAP-type uncharacterized transport system substrate-binding protein